MTNPEPISRAARKDATRARILNAALELVSEKGIAGATIAAIARRASVTRQTVYTQLGDRTNLLRVAFHQAGEQMIERSRIQIESTTDPAEMAVATVLFGLNEFRVHPILREMTADPQSAALLVQAAAKPPAIDLTRRGLKRLVDTAGWTDQETDRNIELILRTTYSIFTSPGPERSEAEMREFIASWLLPAIGLDREAD